MDWIDSFSIHLNYWIYIKIVQNRLQNEQGYFLHFIIEIRTLFFTEHYFYKCS